MGAQRFLIPQIVTELESFCAQELAAKVGRHVGSKELAAENLYEGAVLCLIKVQGYGRGFNKLDGGIAKQIAVAEFLNHWLAESFHFYSRTETNNEFLYFFRLPDVLRAATAQIQGGKQSPAFEFLVFLL